MDQDIPQPNQIPTPPDLGSEPSKVPSVLPATIPAILDSVSQTNLKKFINDVIASVNGRSHAAGTTAMSANTATKVTITTNDFASNITWDTSNNRFKIKASGYYSVSVSATVSHFTNLDNITLSIYKNGSSVSSATFKAGTAPIYAPLAFTDILNCSPNDYIEIYAIDDTSTCQVDPGAFVVITTV